MPDAIIKFSGAYRFLSNFYPGKVEMNGMIYPTVEHAYQAAKTDNIDDRIAIQSARTAGLAKRLGRQLCLIQPNWKLIKQTIMLDLIRKKFNHNSALKASLLATKNMKLEEGNTWGDTYWGICQGVGKNYLGKILMQIRDEINKEGTPK